MRVSNPIACFAIVAASLVLSGCGAPRPMPAPRTYPVPTPAAAPKPYAMTHQYTVNAVTALGKPLAGVAVEVKLKSKGNDPEKTVNCSTDEKGQCEAIVYDVSRNKDLTYTVSYSSTAELNASKEGYYPTKASAFIYSGDKSGAKDVKVTMIQPLDYLDAGFATSTADRELRARVLRFLDMIKLQSLLNDSEVMLGGVGTSEFKGKKYLRVRVNSTTVYNTLKLDNYAIGKKLYDETVRKLLTPLNDYIAAPKAYYGYDIVVYGHSRNFTEKYETASKIEYRFLLPETAVRRYKEKDISGQALLDAGVLLLNDERVEFKLQ